MQKSTKRLLSVLAVLALVLTMAPAGILAVETKADEIQSNLPAGVAETMATEAAKQTEALALIDSLEGSTQAERLASLKASGASCPFCGAENPAWTVLSTTSAEPGWALNYLGLNSYKHIYVYGDFTHDEVNTVLLDAHEANRLGCMLMDDANIVTNGRIRMQGNDCVLNIGGRGSFTSTMASIGADVTGQAMIVQTGVNTLNLYGGTFTTSYTGDKEMHRGVIRIGHVDANLNIWSDDVVIGPDEPTAYATAGAKARSNVIVYAGTLNIYAGTIQNAYSKFSGQGWNVMLQSVDATANMYGGTIQGGSGVSGIVGGNVCFYKAAEFNMYGGTISGGSASYGGNVYVKGGKALLNGEISNGIAATQGGNVHVCESATLELGNVDIYGGSAPESSKLSKNIRISTGTLKLSGNANCSGNILMTAADSIAVEPTFSGSVYVWHTGGVTLGGAVANSSATAAAPGHVYNGAYQIASGVYMPVEMTWDGATGLVYAANGVVYNGSLRAAADAQAAVNTYVADMADEEVEVKPQYVMINGDVNIGAEEVNIDPLDDIFVYGSGTVYGVDRANDAYDANGGSITVFGPAVAAEVTAGGRRYIALEDASTADKYTFHRVESVLTNVTINLDKDGIYYKAQYNFDEIVKDRVVSYGVKINLEGSDKEGYTAAYDLDDNYENGTLVAASHGVYGIFKEGKNNQERGQVKLIGNPYLEIKVNDEVTTVFTAKETSMSMYDAMLLANEKWDVLGEEAQGYLNEYVNEWNALGAWTTELLEELTNFTID